MLWVDNRVRNGATVTSGESGIYVWRWEYRTTPERYPTVAFGGIEYTAHKEIPAALIGKELGTGLGSGYDDYAELQKTAPCTAYEIKGIASDRLIATRFSDSDTAYVYRTNDPTPPETLGAFFDAYALNETLSVSGYSDYTSPIYVHTYKTLAADADRQLLALISACRTAPCVPDYKEGTGSRVAFSVSSEALGIKNRVLTVTKDGYLSTNLADFGYAYLIGEEAAAEIIRYAKEHSAEVPYGEPIYLTGTVTDVGEGYLTLDDSILMQDPADGIVFTVFLKGLSLTRYVDSGYVGVGDTVRIAYDGQIYAGDVLTVETVYAIDKAIVSQNGDVWIPE